MYKRIVVGTDGSTSAAGAVKAAAELAKLCGGELHIVTAFKPTSELFFHPEFAALPATIHDQIDPVTGAKHVTEHAEAAAKSVAPGLTIARHERPGAAVDALCDVAADVEADLIVVGNRGMTGARRVLGSVPNSVAHHAKCAVLIVHTA